jgi:hypothetical protein
LTHHDQCRFAATFQYCTSASPRFSTSHDHARRRAALDNRLVDQSPLRDAGSAYRNRPREAHRCDGAPRPLRNPVDVFDFVEPIRSVRYFGAAGRDAKIKRLKEAAEFLRD